MTRYICDCEKLELPRAEYCAACDAYKKLEAEIERLRGEVEGLRCAYNTVTDDCRNLTEKVIPNIRAERDAARQVAEDTTQAALDAIASHGQAIRQRDAAVKDAERYRWLKKENRSTCPSTASACVTFNIGHDWVKESDLDAAIDAARGEV